MLSSLASFIFKLVIGVAAVMLMAAMISVIYWFNGAFGDFVHHLAWAGFGGLFLTVLKVLVDIVCIVTSLLVLAMVGYAALAIIDEL